MDRTVTAGKIAGLFGLKGEELTLVLYDAFPRDFCIEEPVYVKIDSLTVPLFFRSLARRGQRGATAIFEDIDTQVRAQGLVGLEFAIRVGGGGGAGSNSEVSAEDDDLFFEDLVGWEAELAIEDGASDAPNKRGSTVKGRITAFFDSDYNPLFEVELGGERVLIPAHQDFVVALDEASRRVSMRLPEGLLDLND